MTDLSKIKLGVYEKAIPMQFSWEKKLLTLREAGYDFLELSIDGLEPRIRRLDMTDAEIAEIRRAVDKTGVPILTMALTANRYYPLGDARPAVRAQGMEIVRKGIRLAARLGIRLIQLAPYDVRGDYSTEETILFLKETLRELTQDAAEYGVMLSIEVMDSEVRFCKTVRQARAIIDEIDSPYLNIYTDTGNVAAGGGDSAADLPNGGNRLVASHIKDAVPGCCRKVPYGEGIVDFEACFRAFREMDFHGFFVAEMWSDEDEAFVPYLADAAAFIREKIAAANRQRIAVLYQK